MNSNPPFTPQPNWNTLELQPAPVPGQATARLSSSQSTLVVSPDALPFPGEQFDLVTCGGACGVDLYALATSCERVLKPGGWLVVNDLTVPDDPRAARYVNVLYQFRDPREQTHYAEYEWNGVFLDVGLHVEKSEVIAGDRVSVFAPELHLSTYQVERLHVLLKQAPAAVQEFLTPFGVGSMDTMFIQPGLKIYGQKPE